jgi:hypothetical protein
MDKNNPYLNQIEATIARGRLAIIAELEGKFIALRDDTYVKVRHGKFFNTAISRYVTLTQCTTDTLERYYRASVNIFEFAAPINRTEERALAWLEELPPKARTAQAAIAYKDRMERNERHADKIANG